MKSKYEVKAHNITEYAKYEKIDYSIWKDYYASWKKESRTKRFMRRLRRQTFRPRNFFARRIPYCLMNINGERRANSKYLWLVTQVCTCNEMSKPFAVANFILPSSRIRVGFKSRRWMPYK